MPDTMILTSSPMLHHHTPSNPPHSLSPLNLSPVASPSLRPIAISGMMPKGASGSGTATPLGALPAPAMSTSLPYGGGSGSATRSYARQPERRPYQSNLVSRATTAQQRFAKPVEGDTKLFGEMVAELVNVRHRKARQGALVEEEEEAGSKAGTPVRKGKSLGGSLAGSWEDERAELIVDVPVWSPGCFTDLSTLHALRDTTLSHTHSLLGYLLSNHSIPTTYRLLARSAVSPNQPSCQIGWGCIRLAPSVTSPVQKHSPLKPKYRRSSFVHEPERRERRMSQSGGHHPGSSSKEPERGRRRESRGESQQQQQQERQLGMPPMRVNALGIKRESLDLGLAIDGVPEPVLKLETRLSPTLAMEQAIADDDDDDEDGEDRDVRLKPGYRSGSGSDEEDDDVTADDLIAREVEKRGGKEGMAFLMTLFGGPALILT